MYLNCAGCAIRKSHLAVLAVLVAIRKLQLAVSKKSFEKAASKNVDEIDSWDHIHNTSISLYLNYKLSKLECYITNHWKSRQ